VHAETGLTKLCLAGGVALNCVGNGRILREGPFESIWIQPAAGDAGGALGAALFVWYQLLDRPRKPSPDDGQSGSLLGPAFGIDEVRNWLDAQGAQYQELGNDEDLCRYVAKQIAAGQVVGWFQGRMEFGPRALGARSILADARLPQMQSLLNQKIKFRESFRPFAPAILRERADDYFQLDNGQDSPYMLIVAPVDERLRLKNVVNDARGLDKLKFGRSVIPAVTHVDYSARVQTVDKQRNTLFWKLLKEFESLTGCPVIVNTSFNVRDEPIVCSPEQAYRCFLATNMDVVVLGRCVLHKPAQPKGNCDGALKQRKGHVAR
jgi:carbamoyltransferase